MDRPLLERNETGEVKPEKRDPSLCQHNSRTTELILMRLSQASPLRSLEYVMFRAYTSHYFIVEMNPLNVFDIKTPMDFALNGTVLITLQNRLKCCRTKIIENEKK